MANENTAMAQFGKDSVLYFRKLKDAETEKAAKLALQIEHTLNSDRSTEQTETKDGVVNSPGTINNTLDISAVATLDDVNKMLYEAYKAGDVLECWEVNLSDKRGEPTESGEQEFGATYMQGLLQSWSLPKNVSGTVDISTTLNINYNPVEGKVTLTEADQEAIKYAFRDLEEYTPTP